MTLRACKDVRTPVPIEAWSVQLHDGPRSFLSLRYLSWSSLPHLLPTWHCPVRLLLDLVGMDYHLRYNNICRYCIMFNLYSVKMVHMCTCIIQQIMLTTDFIVVYYLLNCMIYVKYDKLLFKVLLTPEHKHLYYIYSQHSAVPNCWILHCVCIFTWCSGGQEYCSICFNSCILVT